MQQQSVPKTAQASTELVEQVDSEKTQKEKRLADLQQARLQNEKETQAAFEAWAEHFFPLLTPERQY